MVNQKKKIVTKKPKKKPSKIKALERRILSIKNKGIYFVGAGFVILGVLWALSPVYYRYQGTRTNQEMLEKLESEQEIVGQQAGANGSGEEGGTNSEDKAKGAKVIYDDNASRKEVLESASSIIEIPKIDCKLAIAEGTSKAVMKYAVGHFPDCGSPGKGNYCLSGHRQYTYNSFFNRLEEVEKGDLIKITSKGRKFTYRVYDTFTVEPTKMEVLDQTNEPTITLVTCTPIRVATHRFIVKGKLETVDRLNDK